VKGSLTRIFSNLVYLNVTGAAPAIITLTAPQNLAFVNSSPVTVSGTVSDPTATVTVNGLPAPVSGGNFTVSVAVQEGNNTLTASAKNSQGTISTASLQITLDTTPPRISIDAPFDSYSTTDASITVTGKANDTVVGTVNNQQVTVTVNGINAVVANRGFQALNVPLVLGNNAILVTARDRAGNGATAQITVRRDNPTQSIIKIVSGNNQTGAVGAQLASPIVAAVVDGAGNPVSGQIIVFAVTQNNGSLDSAGTVEAVTTNASGQAQARWKLGTRSGAGNNIVEATAVGFAGSAIFTASGTPGNPAMVSLDAGNAQIGAVSQPLPHPFVVVITDSSHNRLANVPVTFTVKQGGGNFNGQTSVTTSSDSDGRAAGILTLGPGDGIANNVAEATFAGNSGFPAAFSASGHVPGNPAATKITGVVLDNSNNPVPGATIRAYLQNVPAVQSGGLPATVTAQSDLQGQFAIQPAPVGFVKIIADGSTVQRPGKWPNLEYDLVTVSGQNNTIGLPVYLLPLDTVHQLCVSDTQGGTLTIPTIPGFSLSVLPGAATFPGGAKTGCVTVTAVHPDKIPMVPGFGQQPRFIVTIQPAGTLFNPPAAVSIPNAEGLAPREVTEMYSFDHDLDTFVSIGSATVSDDGTVIRSDPGVGVLKAGWYCGGPPTPAGTVGVCGACKTCNGSTCVADPLQAGNSCPLTGGTGVCVDDTCQPIEYDPGAAITDTDPNNQFIYSIPFTKSNIGVSPGEKVIFNLSLEDKDRKRRKGTTTWTDFDGVGPYVITLTISGPASWNSAASGTKTLTFNSLATGNAYLFADDPWPNNQTITVSANVVDNAVAPAAPDVGTTKDPTFAITWTLVKRGQCPTTMTTNATACTGCGLPNVFRANPPVVYGYDMGPALPAPATAPYYKDQTILESFQAVSAFNFTMSDVLASFKTAHPTITTADMVVQFFWPLSIFNNGTFVIDATDRIYDRHSGGSAHDEAFTPQAITNGYGFNLPQTYSCGPSDIQSYTITHRYIGGVQTVKKSGP
jgi:hypothetical protein